MKPPDHKRIQHATLVVKKSNLPGAGKGLFTRKAIGQGELIIEYKGAITTFAQVQQNKVISPYVYYVNRNYVIDANAFPASLGRYANDAAGLSAYPGIVNNAQFILLNKKVYLQATADILPGAEICVSYGKTYWDTIRSNLAIDKQNKKTRNQKKVK